MIRPNRSYLVVVRHCSDQDVTIELGGQEGRSRGLSQDFRATRAEQLAAIAGRAEDLEVNPQSETHEVDSIEALRTEIDEIVDELEADPGSDTAQALTVLLDQSSTVLATFEASVQRGEFTTMSADDAYRETRLGVIALLRQALALARADAARATWRLYARAFSPRLPGHADLEIQLQSRSPAATTGARTADAGSTTPVPGDELEERVEVVQQYWLAVRTGLALVLGPDAVPPTYGARMASTGTMTPEIVQTAGGFAAAEIVIAAAPYLFDIMAWGGRSYEDDGHNAFVAPYLGIGVLSGSENGVEAFTSFYFGLEVEMVPELSIAGAFVVRRVNRLGDGLIPGGPADMIPVPTRQDWGVGAAIVINASPDIFRIGGPSQGTDDEGEEDDEHEDRPEPSPSPSTNAGDAGVVRADAGSPRTDGGGE